MTPFERYLATLSPEDREATLAAQARMDAYATSPETKARHARTADMLEATIARGSRDSSGNSVETLVGALRRASR